MNNGKNEMLLKNKAQNHARNQEEVTGQFTPEIFKNMLTC